MPKYNNHRTVPVYKSCTVTFLYSIKVVANVVPGSHKNKIHRCKSRYYIHQRNKIDNFTSS